MTDSKHKLTAWQLFALIVLFELGSAIVMNVGQEAKQDSWIAIIAATALGIGIFIFYRYLQGKRPDGDLFDLARYGFGHVAGTIVIFLYILYFLYVAARVLRDFTELIASSVLVSTPTEVIAFSFSAVVAYMIWHGA